MRRHIPHVTILALALAVAACTGSGSAEPTSPTSTSSATSPPAPTATTASPSPEALPTPTPEATTTPSPTAPATPTPTFTGGIDPPTEPPEGFSEFSVPPPQDLTEEYAAWVLAEWYRAEDRLFAQAVSASDQATGELPRTLQEQVTSLYSGSALDVAEDELLEVLKSGADDEIFTDSGGHTKLSNIALVDATQGCLVVQFVEDPSPILESPIPASEVLVLFEPKPDIDASGHNPTPWHLSLRTSLEAVEEADCS